MTGLLLFAAFAAQTATAPPSKPPAERVRLICTHEPVTGTRFTKRVCQSENQLLARQEADRQAIAEVINHFKTNLPGGN